MLKAVAGLVVDGLDVMPEVQDLWDAAKDTVQDEFIDTVQDKVLEKVTGDPKINKSLTLQKAMDSVAAPLRPRRTSKRRSRRL